MFTGLLEPTGEQARVYVPDVPVYFPKHGVPGPRVPLSLVIGERADTIRGNYSLDPLRDEASVDVGEFEYGAAVDRLDFFLPRPGLYTNHDLSSRKLYEYMRASAEYPTADEALDPVEKVMGLLESGRDGRVRIFEAPFKLWAKDGGTAQFVDEIYRLYEADSKTSIIRDDVQVEISDYRGAHGTSVRLAWSGNQPFLLIERSVATRAYSKLQYEISRVVEAVKVSEPKEALEVINELSLAEEMRLWWLLDRWQATPEEINHASKRANRLTVQHDGDVGILIDDYYLPAKPTLRQRVSEAAGKIIDRIVTPPEWKFYKKMEERLDRVGKRLRF